MAVRGGVGVGLVCGCAHGETVQNRKERVMNGTMVRLNVRKVQRTKNDERAERAGQALQYYRLAGLREPGAAMDTVMSDFLSDIRHLCDRLNLDFGRLDRMAYINYLDERYPR